MDLQVKIILNEGKSKRREGLLALAFVNWFNCF